MRRTPVLLILVVAGCGGPKTPDAPKAPETAPAASSAIPTAASSAAKAEPGLKPTTAPSSHAADPVPHDPNESAVSIEMKPLLDKKTPKTAFPKATATEGECWKTVGLTGDHKKDFDALVASCGAPTGLAEYAKPAEGHLHHVHDKRDTFSLKLVSGFCYRYFAVADVGIKDIDILVEKTSGAIVADNQSGPVAIIEGARPWCMTEDITYEFHIEVDGVGKGHYVFGVWARPK